MNELPSRFDDEQISHLHGGLRVAATLRDHGSALTQELHVSWANDVARFACDSASQRQLRAAAGEDSLDVVVRAAAETMLPDPWRVDTAFVEWVEDQEHRAAAESAQALVTIRTATTSDALARVRGWLFTAHKRGEELRDRDLSDEEVARHVDRLLQDESTESFVAVAEDEVIGHATITGPQPDEVTGEPYVEFVDQWIEPGTATALARAASAGLVQAAGEAAVRLGGTLRGDVAYDLDDPTHGDQVVERLQTRGWTLSFRLWRLRASDRDEL